MTDSELLATWSAAKPFTVVVCLGCMYRRQIRAPRRAHELLRCFIFEVGAVDCCSKRLAEHERHPTPKPANTYKYQKTGQRHPTSMSRHLGHECSKIHTRSSSRREREGERERERGTEGDTCCRTSLILNHLGVTIGGGLECAVPCPFAPPRRSRCSG